MNLLKTYSDKYNRDSQTNFAVACYNQNSIEELTESTLIADKTDMKNWDIDDDDEWRFAIECAKNEKMLDKINANETIECRISKTLENAENYFNGLVEKIEQFT